MTKDCHFSLRKSGVTLGASALGLLLMAGAAFAQATTSQMDGLKLDSNQPIQIESDKLEIHDQEHKADFTGNVKVVQGKTTLQAGHMTVFYKAQGSDAQPNGAKADAGAASISSGNADIDRIIVTDKVFLSSGTQTATADNGSFDMAQQLFVLKGEKVVLSDGPNVFTGCQLTVHMQTGQAQLDSCGGRVQIQLDPKSQKKN
ncbi:LptA/OstA family protein [Rhizobium mongolense]|nr:LptA/OstA family protein [Rhizobium mongolense]